MGQLINGIWNNEWYDTKSTGGKFVRKNSQFRDWITKSGDSGFKAEAGRYHLYVSLACPWAHRALIFRKIKRLEDVISLSIVDPLMGENGWEFSKNEGCIPDSLHSAQFLHQVYTKADPRYSGRVTVPVLWDKEKNTIVNNESAEIIRMFNQAFNDFTDVDLDFYPENLRSDIDEINEYVYHRVNNGVYKCGFATEQAPYEEAFDSLFQALDTLEARLSQQRYLVGNRLTEADWRLFTTLLRFDPVYVGHFKCNQKRIRDYVNLANYLRDLYQYPGVEETVNMTHIKDHYYKSHTMINPTGIVPKGPELDFREPHNRDRFS